MFFSLAQSQEIKLKTEETRNCLASVPQHPCHINPLVTGRMSTVALRLGFSRALILAVLCKDSAGQKTSRSCKLHWASPSKFTVKDLLELAFPFFLCLICSFKVFLFSFCIRKKTLPGTSAQWIFWWYHGNVYGVRKQQRMEDVGVKRRY